MSERPAKGRVLLFVCGVIFLDAVGFGLIMPIMPALLEDVAGLSISDGATIAGLLLTTFAVMQFVFAPILGGLSDLCGWLLHCKVFFEFSAHLGLVLTCVRPVCAELFRWPLWFP